MSKGPWLTKYRKWRAHERERLRKEMGLSKAEFARVCRSEVFAKQIRWLGKDGIYEAKTPTRIEDQRLDFIQQMVRDVKRRGGYRWEKVKFNL